jgi:hypothetical protein
MAKVPGKHSASNYVAKLRSPPETWTPDWLERMNRNFKSVRLLHERLAVLEDDISAGEPDRLSWLERRRASHCVWCDAVLEDLERRFARGEDVDVGQWSSILGTFNRMAAAIGVKRALKQLPSLDAYLAERDAA